MPVRNIKEIKIRLRANFRKYRERLAPEQKLKMDSAIQARLLAMKEYAQADTVFTYVSKPIEVDTIGLISAAFLNHKKVAVPRCVPGTRDMEFYYISSIEELEPGTFGVLEPNPEKSMLVTDFNSGICIVPGLSFDAQGYRLGYGKGYYDRFLNDFKGIKAGLCYTGCTQWNLPHGYYDRPVDVLITEKYLRRIRHQEQAAPKQEDTK